MSTKTNNNPLSHALYERHPSTHGECYVRLVAAGKSEDLSRLSKALSSSVGDFGITEVEDAAKLSVSLEKTITEAEFKTLLAPTLYKSSNHHHRKVLEEYADGLGIS